VCGGRQAETLSPNANGDTIELAPFPGTGEENWEDVDEYASSDDWLTAVTSPSIGTFLDLYNIPELSVSGPIEKVLVMVRIADMTGNNNARIVIKSGSTIAYSSYYTTTPTRWEPYTFSWDANPDTGLAWTISDINSLQIGIELTCVDTLIACSQIYTTVYLDNPPLIKYDSDGNILWSKTGAQYITGDVDVDSSDNVYVGGSSSNGDGGTYAFRKYDSDGNFIWGKNVSGSIVRSIAIDLFDNIFIGTWGYLIKYDSDGNILWTITSTGYISKIAVDSNGNIYFSDDEAFKKCDTNSNLIWQNTDITSVRSIVVDSNNNIYIDESAKIYKFTSDGELIWIIYPPPHNSIRGAMAIDDEDNIYVGTQYDNNELQVYNSYGALLYTLIGNNYTYDIAVDSSHNIYTVWGDHGYSTGTLTKHESYRDSITTDGFYLSSKENPVTVREIVYDSVEEDLTAVARASQRQLSPYMFIYFASGVDGEFTDEEIASMTILEELFAEGATPLGAVSSNEAEVFLNNQDKDFSPLYTGSPYYSYLLPNKEVVILIGIKKTDGVFEYVDMGKFFTTHWNNPTRDIFASVLCHDKLFDIGNRIMPQIPVIQSTTHSILFKSIFKNLGLESREFDIDNITYHADIVALPESSSDKVRATLQSLSESGLCNVFLKRDGLLRVIRNNNVENPPTHSVNDSDFIVNAEQPTDYTKCYSQVEINYHIPYVGEPETVLTVEVLNIAVGTNQFDNIFFNGPVGAVENVKLIGATNSYISSMTIGARSISITIVNSGSNSENVRIEVEGRSINTTDAKIVLTDTDMQAKIGNIKLSINSDYIQNKDDAMIYGAKILGIVTDPSAYINVLSRGNPTMTMLNSLRINDITDNITDLNTVPYRIIHDFTDGYSSELSCIKLSLREGS
jgi:hypothetical protein